MALSDDDWKDVADLIDGYAKDFGEIMTPQRKRDMAWKKAQGRGNPGPERWDFEKACDRYGWSIPDKYFWQSVGKY